MLNLLRKKFRQTKESDKIEIKWKNNGTLMILLYSLHNLRSKREGYRDVDADISETCIKAIMKDECNRSSARCKSKSNSIDTTKIILPRNLFDFDFFKLLTSIF